MSLRDVEFEGKADTRLINKASIINIVYVLLVFFVLLFTLGDIRVALVYTLIAQVISLIANGAFWIKWSFDHLKVKTSVKLGLTTVIAVSLISGISFLIGIISVMLRIIVI